MAIERMASEAYVDGKVGVKYTKPQGGIPAADMSGDVQALLAKADTALQRQDISGKADQSTTYTKSEVDSILQALKGGSRVVVQSLPQTGEAMKIYMVAKQDGQAGDVYDEYIWTAAGAWERIGSTSVDLSEYAKKSEVPTKVSDLTNDSGYLTEHQDISGKASLVDVASVRNDLPYALVSKTPVSGAVSLSNRAVNLVSPTVTATMEWTWADGETGTPVFSNGYWTVQNASFDTYDGPVAGSSTDTEITFAKTDTKSFYYSTTDYDYDTGEQVFVFNVGGEGGEEVRVKCKWSDNYGENIVESIEYDGVEYALEYPATEYNTGNTYSGTGTVAEHVVSLVTTYGPVVTLTMPQAVPGRVRDLIARIDLSQAAGAPPVAFSGGSFEAVDGEMPELVKGVNLLSFTETAAGVFAVAYKEVKPIAQGGS